MLYAFLKLSWFDRKVQNFCFFIKTWLPYEAKVNKGESMWQKKCLKLGIVDEAEELRDTPVLQWRRDIN